MKIFVYMIFLFALSFITSCASITQGDNQVVAVNTPLCEKAKCELRNEQGTYFVPVTPGSVNINKSASSLIVTCSKNDKSETISLDSSTQGATWGNILLGGIIGAAVDWTTGAAYKYDAMINHPLDCSAETLTSDQKCEKLGFEKGTEKFDECVDLTK